MKKEVLKEPIYVEEIVDIIRSGLSNEEIKEKLNDYHDNDIAQSFLISQKDFIFTIYLVLNGCRRLFHMLKIPMIILKN